MSDYEIKMHEIITQDGLKKWFGKSKDRENKKKRNKEDRDKDKNNQNNQENQNGRDKNKDSFEKIFINKINADRVNELISDKNK